MDNKDTNELLRDIVIMQSILIDEVEALSKFIDKKYNAGSEIIRRRKVKKETVAKPRKLAEYVNAAKD